MCALLSALLFEASLKDLSLETAHESLIRLIPVEGPSCRMMCYPIGFQWPIHESFISVDYSSFRPYSSPNRFFGGGHCSGRIALIQNDVHRPLLVLKTHKQCKVTERPHVASVFVLYVGA